MASPVGGLDSGGLPQKKNQFCAKNYAILSKFWYFFPILQHKNFQHANSDNIQHDDDLDVPTTRRFSLSSADC